MENVATVELPDNFEIVPDGKKSTALPDNFEIVPDGKTPAPAQEAQTELPDNFEVVGSQELPPAPQGFGQYPAPPTSPAPSTDFGRQPGPSKADIAQAEANIEQPIKDYLAYWPAASKWVMLGMPTDAEGMKKAETFRWTDLLTESLDAKGSTNLLENFAIEEMGSLLQFGTTAEGWIGAYAFGKALDTVVGKGLSGIRDKYPKAYEYVTRQRTAGDLSGKKRLAELLQDQSIKDAALHREQLALKDQLLSEVKGNRQRFAEEMARRGAGSAADIAVVADTMPPDVISPAEANTIRIRPEDVQIMAYRPELPPEIARPISAPSVAPIPETSPIGMTVLGAPIQEQLPSAIRGKSEVAPQSTISNLSVPSPSEGEIVAPVKPSEARIEKRPIYNTRKANTAKKVFGERFTSLKEGLELVKTEVEQGEAGYRQGNFEKGDQTRRQFVSGTRMPSTFPDWMKDRGLTKKYIVNIIDKANAGKNLTPQQLGMLDELLDHAEEAQGTLESEMTTDAFKKGVVLKEGVELEKVNETELEPGQSFTQHGEEYNVKLSPEGEKIVEDGERIKLDDFESIYIDKGSLKGGDIEVPALDIAQRHTEYMRMAEDQGMSKADQKIYADNRLRQESAAENPTIPQIGEQGELPGAGGVESMGAGRKGETDMFAAQPPTPPQVPQPPPGAGDKPPPGMKESKFNITARESSMVSDPVKAALAGHPSRFYIKHEMVEQVAIAAAKPYEQLKSEFDNSTDPETITYNGFALSDKAAKEGRMDDVLDTLVDLSFKLRQAGRGIQAVKLWIDNPIAVIKDADKSIRKHGESSLGGKLKGKKADKTAKEVVKGLRDIESKNADQVGEDASQEVDPAMLLASRIRAHVASTMKEPKEVDAVTQAVNSLYKTYLEIAPDKAKKIKDPMDMIRAYLDDPAGQAATWNQAKEILKKDIKNEDALAKLDDFIANEIKRGPAKAQKEVVAQELKELQFKVRQIIKEHYSKTDAVKGQLVRALVSRAGVTEAQAQTLTDYATERVNQLTTQEKQKYLERFIQSKIPKTKPLREKEDSLIARLTELTNTGTLNVERARPLIAKELGLPSLDEPTARFIYDTLTEAQTKGEPERVAAYDKVMQVLASKMPLKWSELIDMYRYTNVLGAPRPHYRNQFYNVTVSGIYEPLVNMPALAAVDYIGNMVLGTGREYLLSDVPIYYRHFFGGAIDGAREAWGIMSGRLPITHPDLTAGRESALDFYRKEQAPLALKFTSRLLEAADRQMMSMVQAAKTAIAESHGKSFDVAKREGQRAAEKLMLRNRMDPLGKFNKSQQGIISSTYDQIGQLIGQARKIPYVGMGFKIPVMFLNTPVQLFKMISEKSHPFALLNVIGQADKKQAWANVMVASALTGIGWILKRTGKTTGPMNESETVKNIEYALGKKPYSFVVPYRGKEYYVPMAYSGPAALNFALPAIVDYYINESPTALSDNQVERFSHIVQGSALYLSSQSFMRGMSDTMALLSGQDEMNPIAWMTRNSQQFIPGTSALGAAQRLVDDTLRDKKTPQEIIAGSMPILSNYLPPKRDIYGNQIKRSRWQSLLLPYDIGTAAPGIDTDKLKVELSRSIAIAQNASLAEKEKKVGARTAKQQAGVLYDLLKTQPQSQEFADLLAITMVDRPQVWQSFEKDYIEPMYIDQSEKYISKQSNASKAQYLYSTLTNSADPIPLFMHWTRTGNIPNEIMVEVMQIEKKQGKLGLFKPAK